MARVLKEKPGGRQKARLDGVGRYAWEEESAGGEASGRALSAPGGPNNGITLRAGPLASDELSGTGARIELANYPSGGANSIDVWASNRINFHSEAPTTIQASSHVEIKSLENSVKLDSTQSILANGFPVLRGVALLNFVVAGAAAAGELAAVGARQGDIVIQALNLTTPGDARAKFEAVVSINDQIQQTAAEDLTGETIAFLVLKQFAIAEAH